MADDNFPLLRRLEGEYDGYEEEDEESNEGDNSHDEPGIIPNIPPALIANYDVCLPAQHTYLGTDMEECVGRTVLDDNSLIELPLIELPDVVLIPGQDLPIYLHRPSEVSMMRHVIGNDKTFGVVTIKKTITDLAHEKVGTTAEVMSYKEEENEASGMLKILVKAKGRQRFTVIKTRRQLDGILVGSLRILTEVILDPVLAAVKLNSHKRFACPPLNLKRVTTEMQHNGKEFTLRIKSSRSKYDPYSSSSMTAWPSWVYKQYDSKYLMEKLRKDLTSWNPVLTKGSTSSDPVELSFWVASQLPLDDATRLSLLSLNSAIQRMRCEIDILSKCTVLRCKGQGQVCDVNFTDGHEVMSMSIQGPQGTYVNPNGHIYDIITVGKIKGHLLRGYSHTAYSWFPGYAWTICECRSCGAHIGWRFTATEKTMTPDKFYGLTRSALQVLLDTDDWRPII